MRWIKVANGVGDDPKIWAIAEACRVEPDLVVGKLVRLWAKMTDEARDGDLAGVSDALLEHWANWTGKRGRFSAAVRTHLCNAAGAMAAWERYQGAAIREAEYDRQRADTRRKSEKSPPDSPPYDPPDRPAEMARTVRGKSAATNTTTTTTRNERAGDGGDDRGREAASDRPQADVAAVATRWAGAINTGVEATHGPQQHTLRWDRQLSAVRALLAAGVDPDWAADWLHHRAQESTGDHVPGSVKFFHDRLLRAWREHTDAPAAVAYVPGVDPAPRAARPPTASRHEAAARETFDRAMRRPEDPRAQLARLRQQHTATTGNGAPPLALPAKAGP